MNVAALPDFLLALEATEPDVPRHLCFRVASGEGTRFREICDRHHVRVRDGIRRQLAEWAQVSLPREPRGGDAQKEHAEAAVRAAGEVAAIGVWVYYPWRRAAVHLLDPDAFAAVRTNRNRDKITPVQQAELRRKRIGVIGLSVGHASALVLAQEGIGGLFRIADFDRIDLSNLNRLRTSLLHVGEAKTEVTMREIAEIDPFVEVEIFPDGVADENIERFLAGGGPLDLLVEECDTLHMKLRARALARRHGIPVVMDTNDRGLLDIERFDREPDRPLLHGLLDAWDLETLGALSPEDRRAAFFAFFGGEPEASPEFRDAVGRLGHDLVGYPQLASDVHLGAALVAHAARRVLLGQITRSSRTRIDLAQLIPD